MTTQEHPNINYAETAKRLEYLASRNAWLEFTQAMQTSDPIIDKEIVLAALGSLTSLFEDDDWLSVVGNPGDLTFDGSSISSGLLDIYTGGVSKLKATESERNELKDDNLELVEQNRNLREEVDEIQKKQLRDAKLIDRNAKLADAARTLMSVLSEYASLPESKDEK